MHERRDIVIVGGGPAGAVVAFLLARAGHDVLLLERSRVPRPKACGDCLSAQATRVLDRLGLLPAIESLHPARLEGWRIVAADGSEFSARFADVQCAAPVREGLAVSRDRLDAALLQCAARAGAEIRTGAHVRHGAAGQVVVRGGDSEARLSARLVIGADGLRSVVARSIAAVRAPGPRRKLSLTAHVRGVREIGRFGEMHVTGGACIGIAPVDADLESCNVTVVVSGRESELRETRASRRAQRLSTFVEAQHQHFPGLRGRLPDLSAEPPVWLASGPFDRPVRKVVDHGVALVGDAAGYFDPFTGQGIYQALIGAERLAAVASAALAHAGIVSRGRLAPYAATHERLTRGTRGVQRVIDAVLARVATGNAAIRLLARSRTLRTTLLGVTADLLPPHALLDPRCVTACIHALLRPT